MTYLLKALDYLEALTGSLLSSHPVLAIYHWLSSLSDWAFLALVLGLCVLFMSVALWWIKYSLAKEEQMYEERRRRESIKRSLLEQERRRYEQLMDRSRDRERGKRATATDSGSGSDFKR